jgi:uncharacterized SAM-binding protein YcdF (DUF218 family)
VNIFWRTARRSAVSGTAFATVIMVLNGVAGFVIFGNAADSPASHVDAVVVLGGEHDGREGYGLALARQGLASTVLLSDPYSSGDELMKKMCTPQHDSVEVICFSPDPPTTRGEALMTRRLALERHWKSVLVVSWQYHLPRARLVFHQCLSNSGIAVSARAVPRGYAVPEWYWQYIYLYQFAGIAKATTVDRC